jgi:hypothetical protein
MILVPVSNGVAGLLQGRIFVFPRKTVAGVVMHTPDLVVKHTHTC